ncbi:unnamed protein product [Prunus brigantina]
MQLTFSFLSYDFIKEFNSLVHLTLQLKMSLISLGFALIISFLYSCTCLDYLYGFRQIKFYLSS